MKNYKTETSFVSPEEPKALANKTGVDFHSNICGKLSVIYDAIHDFSVWLKTGSKPADINRFRSHTGKPIKLSIYW